MTSVKLKLHKNKLLKDGTYPLVFQIIHNRRKKVLYTNYKIRESDFDPVSGKVRADDSRQLSDRSAQRMNRALNRERKTLLSKIAFYEEHGIDFCVEDLDNRSSRQHNVHLLQYMNKQIREKYWPAETERQRHTKARIHRCRNTSGERMCGRAKSIRCSSANTKNSSANNRCRTTRLPFICGTCEPSTTTFSKTAFRLSGNRLSRRHAPRCIKPSSGPCRKKHGASGALHVLPQRTTSGVRTGYFPLQFLHARHVACGHRFSQEGTHFRQCDPLCPAQSSQPLRITITEPLAALIAKYDNDSPYIFPILRDNAPFSHYDQYRSALARINRNLKRVGLKLGLTTPLTTYVARHTWATLAKQCGAPVAVISEGLGHASEKITHIYLKEFDSDVLDRINEIVTRL